MIFVQQKQQQQQHKNNVKDNFFSSFTKHEYS
jgi:hypothetical protein